MKEKPSDGVRLDKWLWAARFTKRAPLPVKWLTAERCITTVSAANRASWLN